MELIVVIIMISFIVKKLKNSNVDVEHNKRKSYQKQDGWKNSSKISKSTQWKCSNEKKYPNNQNERWKEKARENIQKAKNRARGKMEEWKKEANTSSILERAKENMAEYKDDTTLHILETEHQYSERVAPAEHYHPEDMLSGSLLGTVEDLMIKGYEGNLCFERDFVGEALDMISRFTVPSEVPDFSEKHDDVA